MLTYQCPYVIVSPLLFNHRLTMQSMSLSSLQTPEKNDTATGQGERNHLITKRDLALREGDVHTLVSAISSTQRVSI